MQPLQSPTKTHSSSRLINLLKVLSSILIIYLLVLLFILSTSKYSSLYSPLQELSTPTNLNHIVFGIFTSQDSWPKSKEYVKLWWNSHTMRGCAFLDRLPPDADSYNDTSSLPPLCVSEDTSGFRYTHGAQHRFQIRIARMVLEAVARNHSNVRWYVFADESSVFITENLVKTLSKYDHRLWHYIGANSENLEQNREFGFKMAFLGAGIAISSPLAKVLARVIDSCMDRYAHLYGGDGRVFACLAELGIGMIHEPGFHQFDIRGNALGLLTAHPVTPLVSIHSLDQIDPLFPGMNTLHALQHFFKAANADPQRILQQTVCYDRWFSWTISVSWGYAIQVFPNHVYLPDAIKVGQTFRHWRSGNPLTEAYVFNTRELHPVECARPTIFFFEKISKSKGRTKTTYKRADLNCEYDGGSPRKIKEIRVYAHKLDLTKKQLQAPRRQCCNVLPSSNNEVLDIAIKECKEEELIYLHL